MSSITMKMNTKQWWIDTDRRKWTERRIVEC